MCLSLLVVLCIFVRAHFVAGEHQQLQRQEKVHECAKKRHKSPDGSKRVQPARRRTKGPICLEPGPRSAISVGNGEFPLVRANFTQNHFLLSSRLVGGSENVPDKAHQRAPSSVSRRSNRFEVRFHTASLFVVNSIYGSHVNDVVCSACEVEVTGSGSHVNDVYFACYQRWNNGQSALPEELIDPRR